MEKNSKKIMLSLIVVLIILILNSWALNLSIKPVSSIVDFYGTSEEVSLKEFLNYASENNLSIYLPNKLPSNNFNMTAIYLKRGPFIAIIVYSTEGNKDYKTAEFTIEMSSVNPDRIPTFSDLQIEAEKSQDIIAMEINNWPIIIYEHAYNGHPEFRKKYGEYTLIAYFWIEQVCYSMGAPTLNNAMDLIPIIESMSLMV